MNLGTLFAKTDKELNSMKKEDIVKAIVSNKWLVDSQNSQIERLNKEVEMLKAPYNQAKQIVCGAAGLDVPIDEYSKKPLLDQVDLCYAIGALLNKHYHLLGHNK